MQKLAIEGEMHTNSIGMQFVRIEPGNFMMGSENAALSDELIDGKAYLRDGDADEKPVHQVTLTTPFYIGIFQVTNAQYEEFQPAHNKLRGLPNTGSQASPYIGFSQDDDEAVVFVDWHDANRFCEWLSEKEGLPYRLPTEAEWEYVCRAGTMTHFHTGGTLPPEFHKNIGESWYPDAERSRGAEEVMSLHVGQTPANAWGVHDMHGNVEEWCQDWYGPYEPHSQTDPVGRETGLYRVTRGGSHSRCSVTYVLRIEWGRSLKTNTGTSDFVSFAVKCPRHRLLLHQRWRYGDVKLNKNPQVHLLQIFLTSRSH